MGTLVRFSDKTIQNYVVVVLDRLSSCKWRFWICTHVWNETNSSFTIPISLKVGSKCCSSHFQIVWIQLLEIKRIPTFFLFFLTKPSKSMLWLFRIDCDWRFEMCTNVIRETNSFVAIAIFLKVKCTNF